MGKGNITQRWLRLYAIVLAVAFAALGGLGWREGVLSPTLAGGIWLALVNLVTLHAFWRDKRIAITNREARHPRERTPEAVLHALALLGGSPGAWLAISVIRHKTRKATFLFPLVLITVAQGALIWWLTR